MALRILAVGMLLSMIGGAAAGAESCVPKKFPANAQVRSGELDDLFGKMSPPEKPLRFAYVSGAADPEEKRLLAGFESETKRFGLSFAAVSPQADVFAGAPDVLLLGPGAGDTKRLLGDALTRRVPTIAVGTRLEGARASVAADQPRFGAMVAEYLHEQFPLGTSVAQVTGPASAPDAAARAAGFIEELRYYPRLSLAGSFAADGSKNGARDAVLAAMTAHPEIKGIYANSDRMALGALEALKTLKLFDVVVVGSDGTSEGRDALARRTIKGTAARFPEKEAEIAVQTGLRLVACQQIPPWILPPQVMMTPKSLEDFASLSP